MIIFGTKKKYLLTERIMDKCRNCGSSNTIDMHIYQTYGHVFWIPLVPTAKEGISVCSSCGQRYEARQMPEYLIQPFIETRNKAKTPIWTFGGLGLFAIGIGLLVYSGIQDNKMDAKYVKDPQRADEYEIKTEDDMYTLYRVEQVEGDSVVLLINDWESDQQSGINSILRKKKNEGFSDNRVTVSREDITKMYQDNHIIEVNR